MAMCPCISRKWVGSKFPIDLSQESRPELMGGSPLRVLAILSILIISAVPLQAADLSSGDPLVIDIIMIDRKIARGGSGQYRRLLADPSISILGVPQPGHYAIDHGMDPENINRVMRIYMPRNFQHLLDNHDMILLRDSSCGNYQYPVIYFDPRWMSWFVDAVGEEGMPFAMWGGDASWGGGGPGGSGGEGSYKSWGETLLDPILPFEGLGGYNPPTAEFQKPYFTDPDHPLARLPWEYSGPVELLNNVEPKQGANVIARAVAPGKDFTWIGWWMHGEGKVVGEAQVFGSKGTTNRMLNDWQWYQDFIIYLVYFNVDKPIPTDIVRAHHLREEINTHLAKSSLLISLLEFVERYGASTLGLYGDMDEIDAKEKEAEELFRQDDYDGAEQIFEDIHTAWEELNRDAIEAKERALLWVYVIEWLTVSAASLISGVILWAVMVRRRLYREIGVTRMSIEG